MQSDGGAGLHGGVVAYKEEAVGADHLVVGVGYGYAAAVGVFVEAAGKFAHIPFGRFGALINHVFDLVIVRVGGVLGHAGAVFQDGYHVFGAADVDHVSVKEDGVVVDPASSTWEFIHTFPSSGNYNVAFTVTSSFGCTSTNNRVVAVTDTVVVPNVFTPDGDGVNDVWSIKSNGKDKLTVKVYSRAGVLVYEEHAAIILWDGKTAYGKDLVSGVYYYVVDRDDKVLPAQKGFFYLLRGK